MKFSKRITVFLTALIMVMSLTACGEDKESGSARADYDSIKIGQGTADGIVAENDNFTLSWEAERACVLLTDKTTGAIWSTIPYEYYETGDTTGKPNSIMGAPLMLEYVSNKNMAAVKTMNGYTGIIKSGRISSKKIENGIKVYYCFDKLEIIIPVEYTLNGSGINIALVPDEIIEFNNLVYKISLAPFMCSTKNSEDSDSQYIVVPSGSGALMYTDVRSGGEGREYSEMVYGEDPARHESEKYINTQTVRLPMFGAKNGENALCAIIEDGAACAEVETLVGDEKIGWSAVWATFALRGSNVSAISFNGGQTTDVENISETISSYERLSIGYYPLFGENADYSGMASVYRRQLENILQRETKEISETPLTLNILGGLQEKELFLGIPYQKTVSATTFAEALQIIKSVKEVSELPVDVVLSGFGESGLDIGKLAGGFNLFSVFGGRKDFAALNEYCKDNGTKLFADFDIVNFNSSSNGFSKTFDAAKSSNSFTAYQHHYSVSLRNQNEDYKRYVLLSRASLTDAADKLLDMAEDNGLAGIGLSTLSNTAYSDYDNSDYAVRNEMEEQVSEIFASAHKKGLSVVASQANSYAAVAADKLIGAPVTSSMFDILDADIPLYQMVFKGITDISVESVNTAENSRTRFLQAIEGGSGIAFTISARYESDFAVSKHSAFAVSFIDDNIGLIGELSAESKDFYSAVSGAQIIGHSILGEKLRKTVFDNGVTVWVNYGDEPAVLPEGTVDANSFMFKEGV